MTTIRQFARANLEHIEGLFDRGFGPAWNPLYQLGALGWFFYWIVVVSGVYLFIFFDTGITDAYESVEYITNVQWYAAGVMRSLHRYASDAMIIVMMLHLVREFAMGRYRGARSFAWITGVPILWFIYACGITGYWLVWDKLAQYVAIATTEWLDTLPIFGEAIARNFLHETTLSSRFFTLMVFIHIAVPLILLFIMWVHIQRHSSPKVNPPRGLAVGTLVMLTALSLAYPAVSQGPANLNTVPAVVNLDWFYLPAYPLLDLMPGISLWAIFGIGTVVLLLVPWLPLTRRPAAAVVDLDNCNGCGRCVDDCPFGAVSMQPRTDDKPYMQEARVDPNLCTGCGICAGACPTATPFRRASALTPGIDIPGSPIRELREKTLSAASQLSGNDRVIVYGCQSGVNLDALQGAGIATLCSPCTAALPPSFLDFVISRHHADGVFLTGCRQGDCFNRQGIAWVEQRIAGQRDPYLRNRVPRERIATLWAGVAGRRQLAHELDAFRHRLRQLGPIQKDAPTLHDHRTTQPKVDD